MSTFIQCICAEVGRGEGVEGRTHTVLPLFSVPESEYKK